MNVKEQEKRHNEKNRTTNGEDIKEIKVEVEEVKEVKKQAISKSYTLKALGKNIDKLEKVELITKEEAETLRGIKSKAIMKYMETAF